MNRIMTITVDADWTGRLRYAGVLAQTGLETGQYQGEFLNFATPIVFFGQLGAHRWNLLRQLIGNGTLGVRELARRVGRDVKRVHEDAKALVELGLLEKTERGALHCPYARIEVKMALGQAAVAESTAEVPHAHPGVPPQHASTAAAA